MNKLAFFVILLLQVTTASAADRALIIFKTMTSTDMVRQAGQLLPNPHSWTPEKIASLNKQKGPAREKTFNEFLVRYAFGILRIKELGAPTRQELSQMSSFLAASNYPFTFHKLSEKKQVELLSELKLVEGTDKVEEEANELEPIVFETHPVLWVLPKPDRYMRDEDGTLLLSKGGLPRVRQGQRMRKTENTDGMLYLQYEFDKTAVHFVDLRAELKKTEQVLDVLYLIASSKRNRHLPIDLFHGVDARKTAFRLYNDPEKFSPKFNIRFLKWNKRVSDIYVNGYPIDLVGSPKKNGELHPRLSAEEQNVWLKPNEPGGFDIYVRSGIETGKFLIEFLYRLALATNGHYRSSLREDMPIDDLSDVAGEGAYPQAQLDFSIVNNFRIALHEAFATAHTQVRELVGDWTEKNPYLQNVALGYLFDENRSFWNSLPPTATLVSPETMIRDSYLLPEVGFSSCPDELLKGFDPQQIGITYRSFDAERK